MFNYVRGSSFVTYGRGSKTTKWNQGLSRTIHPAVQFLASLGPSYFPILPVQLKPSCLQFLPFFGLPFDHHIFPFSHCQGSTCGLQVADLAEKTRRFQRSPVPRPPELQPWRAGRSSGLAPAEGAPWVKSAVHARRNGGVSGGNPCRREDMPMPWLRFFFSTLSHLENDGSGR